VLRVISRVAVPKKTAKPVPSIHRLSTADHIKYLYDPVPVEGYDIPM
jgi:hypothetical protein